MALTGDPLGAVLITAMVGVSLGLRLHHARRFDHLLAGLRNLAAPRVTVLRRPGRGARDRPVARTRNARLLAPGDLVLLGAGDVVPADCRIVAADGLAVDQAMFTGEPMPVAKFATGPGAGEPGWLEGPAPARSARPANVLDAPALCLTGTTVAAGSATAVVAKTGASTILAATTRKITQPRWPTSADLGLRSVTWLLIRLMGALVPAVFILTVLTHHDRGWAAAALFAVAVAVGGAEMLPVILAAAHGRGLSALARRGIAVTRPSAVQDLAGMDVLCTDKTGTLTVGLPQLARWLAPDGSESAAVLDYALLSAVFTAGRRTSLDTAVLDACQPLDREVAQAQYDKAGEIGFDFTRRRASVILDSGAGPCLVVTKGAVTAVLDACTTVRLPGGEQPLSGALRAQAADHPAAVERRNAAARGRLPHDRRRTRRRIRHRVGDRADAGRIPRLHRPAKTRRGTGHPAARRPWRPQRILDRRRDRRRRRPVPGCRHPRRGAGHRHRHRPARRRCPRGPRRPHHGLRRGRPAAQGPHRAGAACPRPHRRLPRRRHQRHAGAARRRRRPGRPRSACVARQAADAILLGKDLRILHGGVAEARHATLNATKYLKATVSANLGNVLSILAASAFLPFLPMLPLQILVQNLGYDLAQLTLPLDHADPGQLTRPHRWSARDLTVFIACFAPLSSAFDLITFAFLQHLHTLGTSTASHQMLFHACWFTESLLTQILAVLVIRTGRVPLLHNRPAAALGLACLARLRHSRGPALHARRNLARPRAATPHPPRRCAPHRRRLPHRAASRQSRLPARHRPLAMNRRPRTPRRTAHTTGATCVQGKPMLAEEPFADRPYPPPQAPRVTE